MITKISKVLTVLVTVLSLAFLGATAVSSIARSDWKSKSNEFPRAKTQELQTQIDALKKQSDEYAALTPQTIASIAADQKALVAKSAALNQYAATLESAEKKLREENAATAVTAQEKLDTDKLRREEVQRLQAQFEELVSQRAAAQAEVLRLRDLVYQSRGVLQRAVRRNESLKEALGRPDAAPYDPAQDEDNLPPARFPKPAGSAPGTEPAENDAEATAVEEEEIEPTRLTDPAEGEPEEMEGEEPAAEEQMPAEEAASEEPGQDESSSDEPSSDEPGAEEPGAEEPGEDNPFGVDEPTTEPTEGEQPAADDAAMEGDSTENVDPAETEEEESGTVDSGEE